MFINISNTIYIPKVEEYLLQIITSELTHENPLYIEAKKCNRPTFGISKVIINFEVDSFGGIYIPKGYLNRLFSITNDLGIKLEINDARNIIPFDKIYDHNINLRPYQYTALENIAQHNNGLLVAPAGSGKTIMGISLILMCNQKCLWITHTKQLLNQFVDRIQQFVNIPETDIGLIQKGSWDLDKPVTAGLVQTLIRDEDKLNSISNSFGNIIIDECLVAGTQISLYDGTEKAIEEITDGDISLYGAISNSFNREVKQTIKLRTGVGELEGTTTHKLPYIAKTKEKKGLENKLLPFNEKDIVFENMASINKGDYLLCVETMPHIEKISISIQKSRLLALIACDGHIEKKLNCLQVGIAKDKDWFLNEMIENTKVFKDFDIRTSKCKRGDLLIRSYSKDAITFVNTYVPKGKKSNIIEVPSIVKEALLSEIKEYLQVVFDTEGAVTDQITLTMSSHKYIKDIQFLLRKFGIIGRLIPIKRKNYLRIVMSGYDAFLFWKKIGFSIERKQKRLDKLMFELTKFRRLVNYKGVTYRCVPVLEKKLNNIPKKVYDFTTEQHIFLANGILSSNCHHTPSTTFTKIIKNMNSYYLYGLTATPDRRDGLENIMLQNIGPIRYEVSRNAVAHKIITPVIIPRYINTNAPDMIEYGKLLSFLVEDDVRNSTIISDVLNEAKQGNICIVATERVNHVEILYKRIKKYWDKTVAVVGKNSDKDRDIALNSLNSGEATVLICTSHLLGEGFDHAPLNRLFICLPFRNASRCEQLVGRVQRISPNKNDALIYDYIDNHGLTKNQFINYSGKPCRKAVYEKLGCIIK